MAGHTTGSADLEWFSIQPDGTRILLNDTNTQGSLLTFRARTVITPLKLNAPTVSGGAVTISWTGSGTLQEATAVTGPWLTAPSQLNPQTVQATGMLKLYRIHNP